MARTEITIKDLTSTLNITDNDTAIDSTLVTNGLAVTDFFERKINTGGLLVTNAENASKVVTIKAGTATNALGANDDLTVTVGAGKQVLISDIEAFKYKQSDMSLYVDFATGMTGTIIAVGRK
jgi:hypothetical protein